MALLQPMLRTENQAEGIKAVGFFLLAIQIICSVFIDLKGEKTFLCCFPAGDEKTRTKPLRWIMEWAVEREVLTDDCYPVTGCKENHFYSLPFRQAQKLAFTSPDVISTSPKSFLTSRIDFTVLLLFEFLKKHHLPVGQVKNRSH